MTYTVTTTSGAALASIADGTVNTTATSLALIGKNYAGYGIFLNENYVQLLENFSNSTPPTSPLTGQLWYDTVNDILKVYNSDINLWKPISSSIAQGTAPSGSISVTGDIWWDTTNAQLKVWSGSAWITIGPSYSTSGTGSSGSSGTTESILDTLGNPHVVTKFSLSGSVIAILSKDATFIPQTAIPGFTSIIPGFNLISSSTLTGAQFTGATTGSSTLGGLTASQFLRSDISQTTNFAFGAAGGLTVGSDLVFNSTSPTVSVISQTTLNKNIRFDLNRSGVTTTALTITAATNTITVANALSVTGTVSAAAGSFGTIVTTGNIAPSANSTVYLGTVSNRYNTIYGVTVNALSVQANYADLAERFEADAVYIPGTVVEIGGLKEITAVVQDLSDAVFGVISTAAGFLLNGAAGSNETHPPIAVNGRVPVRVIGTCKKGDRLVSAGNGLARAANRNELTAFNVIGRALANKTTDDEGLVEAIVKLNS
jgi:hypothetical protein